MSMVALKWASFGVILPILVLAEGGISLIVGLK